MNTFFQKAGHLLDNFRVFLKSLISNRAVDVLEAECSQLEQMFSLLVCGNLVGLPSPPIHITLELLPDMEKEIHELLSGVDIAAAPLSELFSTMDVG